MSDRTYYAHITEFLVRTSYVGRDVGRGLMEQLLAALSDETVVTIFAEPDAEAFYRGFLFAPTAGGMLMRREDS